MTSYKQWRVEDKHPPRRKKIIVFSFDNNCNMEVHHHPDLHKGRKFKEYFLEFLMIFLAVTMGFFAESLRERIVNSEKENRYMESLVQDLNDDISELHSVIPFQSIIINKMDRALQVPVENIKDIRSQHQFYDQFVYFYSFDGQFIRHDRTLSQLKNSGGYSLIKKRSVLDSIADLNLYYDQAVKFDGDYYYEYEQKLIDMGAQVMKMSPLNNTGDTVSEVYPEKVEIFTMYDRQKLEQLYSWIRNLRVALNIYIGNEIDYQKKAERLKEFISKEYRLKKRNQ